MPLFGRKKDYKEAEKGGYPTQPAYPQQGQPPPPPPPQQMYAQPPVNPNYQQGPPPPYSMQGYQGYAQQPYGQPQGAPQFPQQYPQQPYPQQGYAPPPQNQTVVVPGGFDAGARFGPGPVNIPPPPPGCAPNMAQLAAASGQNVVVTQRSADFMTGGSDGGYVVW